MINKTQNSNAGTDLYNGLYRPYRILTKDKFYIPIVP